jgi:hypothetical protein
MILFSNNYLIIMNLLNNICGEVEQVFVSCIVGSIISIGIFGSLIYCVIRNKCCF